MKVFSFHNFALLSMLLVGLLLLSCSRPPPMQIEQKPVLVQSHPMPRRMASKTLYRKTPLKPLIVIDAGHGGDDAGAEADNYTEKHLNLATARLVRTYLKQLGYRTSMTRNADFFVPLDQRAAFANSQKPALFVSLHYNSAPSKKAEGIEIYYYHSDPTAHRVAESKKLAHSVLNKILQNTSAKSRGVRDGNFAVIRETNMPAILVEGGFLTNEKEVQKIKNPIYLKQLAWGVVQGIDEYLHSH
ncbi:MAG: N-acetylmuramoyl-L-alanine amidase [Parachlamydia sp.]|nr:MAG: N-acetylmuramoyl-L-alanine amidase [Parachlamydia sp.]